MPERLTDREQDIVRDALARERAGVRLTQRQERILAKARRIGLRIELDKMASRVPKSVYKDWVERTDAQLKRHEESYGIPCVGDEIDVRACLRAMHLIIADSRGKITATDTTETLLQADQVNSSALERLREEHYQKAKRENEEAEGKLMRRDDVASMHEALWSAIREGSAAIDKEYGAGASADLLDRIETVLKRMGGAMT